MISSNPTKPVAVADRAAAKEERGAVEVEGEAPSEADQEVAAELHREEEINEMEEVVAGALPMPEEVVVVAE